MNTPIVVSDNYRLELMVVGLGLVGADPSFWPEISEPGSITAMWDATQPRHRVFQGQSVVRWMTPSNTEANQHVLSNPNTTIAWLLFRCWVRAIDGYFTPMTMWAESLYWYCIHLDAFFYVSGAECDRDKLYAGLESVKWR